MATKTNSGLVAYAKAQVGLPYWYGTYGQTATQSLYESKKKQYPSYYTASDFTSQIGKRVHDCVGLIKGYLWSSSATGTPTYNSAQDKSASGMYAASTTKGKISTFPKKAGQLVYKGTSASAIHHVGVYGGDGYVYEAKGHAYGVVKTAYKESDWNFWSQCPYITDDSSSASSSGSSSSGSSSGSSSSGTSSFAAGDKVTLSGVKIYKSSTTKTDSGTKSGTYYIWSSAVTNGRIRITNKAANVGVASQVTGWVDVTDIGGTVATSSGSTSSGTSSTTKAPTYKVGTVYKTQVDCLNVRKGAGTGYAKVSYANLTANGKANANSSGQLKKGTSVTCKEIKTVGSDIWIRIPSGWIAAYYEGEIYVS